MVRSLILADAAHPLLMQRIMSKSDIEFSTDSSWPINQKRRMPDHKNMCHK